MTLDIYQRLNDLLRTGRCCVVKSCKDTAAERVTADQLAREIWNEDELPDYAKFFGWDTGIPFRTLEERVAAFLATCKLDLAQLVIVGDVILRACVDLQMAHRSVDTECPLTWPHRFDSTASGVACSRRYARERSVTNSLAALGNAVVRLCKESFRLIRRDPVETLTELFCALQQKLPFRDAWNCPIEWPTPGIEWLFYCGDRVVEMASFLTKDGLHDWFCNELLWDEGNGQDYPDPFWRGYIDWCHDWALNQTNA